MVNRSSTPRSAPQGTGPLLDQAPCGLLSVRDDGVIEYANATLLTLLGWEALQGQNIVAILPLASRIFYQTHVFPMLRVQGAVSEIYFSLRSRSGQDIPILANGVRRQRQGDAINDCVVIPIRQRMQYEDEILRAKKQAEAAISAQKQAEATLKHQYERAVALGQITQHIRESLELTQIFAVAAQEVRQCLAADRVGIYRFAPDGAAGGSFVSEAVAPGVDAVMVTQVPHQGFGDHYRGIRHNAGTLAIRDLHEMRLLDEHSQLFSQFQVQASLVVPLQKGTDLWGLIVIHQCSGPRYWQGVEVELVEDIAAQLAIAIHQADLVKQLQSELQERQLAEVRLTQANAELQRATGLLEQMAHIDPLTQIANRRRFSDRLEQEWARLRRDRLPLSLLLFDVDYFKCYNDTYGHQSGDDCLYALAQAAQKVLGRPTDLLARYGGEEFVIILPNTIRQGAIAVARHIHQAIAALAIAHQASAVGSQITISLGISTLIPSQKLTSTVLVQQADQALYQAKRQGRNRSVVFDRTMSRP
ncbi:diguanylate cyclase domain-containing protein [Phormidium tenue]|uniref:Diguanylate cyclase n=1 Tax=Phormidium tenue NIES-30 TaxID=549789 RepID=A0A1U7J3J5_9CYAN|nr:diguanylate cyclase [Phormidium tenue]MBD2233353.1 diguanylate cyclase [Phormidium tenue FACHB-1052]OKH46817.1 diguanylate cyclase [Phormidium tenue NIES-30]